MTDAARRSRVRHTLVFLALATPAAAQLLPQTPWTQLATGPASGRQGAAMAYDAKRDVTVLFGGTAGGGGMMDTWRWDGAAWSSVVGAQPPGRWGHGMVYDRARDCIVLFGGFVPNGGVADAQALGDTWEWNGSQWLQRAPLWAPSPRGAFGMVFDTARNRTVLFGGGNGAAGALYNDTWQWDGTNWTAIPVASGPSPRRGVGMAFDWVRNQCVVFGGRNASGVLSDTWTFNVLPASYAWQQQTPATSPPARAEAAMLFDPLCGVALLGCGQSGSFNGSAPLGDWWGWNGANWAPFTGAVGAVTSRSGAATAYDFRRGRSLLFGGRSGGGAYLAATFARDGGCRRDVTNTSAPVFGTTARFRYDYPTHGAGNIGLWLVTAPFAASLFLPFADFFVHNDLRVDVGAQFGSSVFLTDGTGSATFDVPIGLQPNLIGLSFDVQALDLNFAHGFLQWSASDVAATVLPAPINPALDMAPVPAGTFAMGPSGNQRQVTMTRSFWMAKYEVMQAQYLAVMGTNPSFHQGGLYGQTPQRPVENVSWHDANRYCELLTNVERAAGRVPAGYEYRLPTEAEWEYCCRAGSTTLYGNGNTLTTAEANVANFNGQTVPVGFFPPNAWGLHDMHGNVEEWCLDSFALYAAGPATNPYVRVGSDRVCRGGDWSSNVINCQSASRTYGGANGGTNPLTPKRGFRVVLAPITYPLELRPIAAGTFQMGSTGTQAAANEQPVRTVTLSSNFWMGTFEVTQAEYRKVVGVNPSYFDGPNNPGADQRPVEVVDWFEACAFCAALTASEQAVGRLPAGFQYRLPTEAEWEYCCRAGTTTEWHTGTFLLTSQANFHGALANGTYPAGQTAVVGSYAPNPFGLHDMHGNAYEWCLDSYALYAPGPVTDPFVTGGLTRVGRGGAWSSIITSFDCRSARRDHSWPDTTHNLNGFRVVLAPALVP